MIIIDDYNRINEVLYELLGNDRYNKYLPYIECIVEDIESVVEEPMK